MKKVEKHWPWSAWIRCYEELKIPLLSVRHRGIKTLNSHKPSILKRFPALKFNRKFLTEDTLIWGLGLLIVPRSGETSVSLKGSGVLDLRVLARSPLSPRLLRKNLEIKKVFNYFSVLFYPLAFITIHCLIYSAAGLRYVSSCAMFAVS